MNIILFKNKRHCLLSSILRWLRWLIRLINVNFLRFNHQIPLLIRIFDGQSHLIFFIGTGILILLYRINSLPFFVIAIDLLIMIVDRLPNFWQLALFFLEDLKLWILLDFSACFFKEYFVEVCLMCFIQEIFVSWLVSVNLCSIFYLVFFFQRYYFPSNILDAIIQFLIPVIAD